MATNMRVVSLFSGGKDSNYSLSWALRNGMEVTHLLTVYSDNLDSYMYQSAGIELAEMATLAIGIDQVKVWTVGEEESEVTDLEDVMRRLVNDEDIEGLVSGALRSKYQKDRIALICKSLSIKNISPLWHKDPLEHLLTIIKDGYDILIVSVSAEGLDESWLGRRLDLACVKDLIRVKERSGINIDGEGGEFETVVLDAPHFKQRIVIDDLEPVWSRDSGRIMIKKAHLESR